MRILLTGTTGKLGGFLARRWESDHEITPVTRREFDLRNPESLRRYLESQDFDALVNPAAIATPEACENDPHSARLVNIEAPRVMARICDAKEARFVHFSTDYVLDGSEPGFKDESAPVRPNNVYGATKLAGEEAVMTEYPAALVARVSWVFGVAGEAFLEKVIRLIRAGHPLEAVADKFSMPTSAPEMAGALENLLEARASGLIHLTQSSDEPVSWHRYATEVAAAACRHGITPAPVPVTPRKMADIPALATNRPIHTAMTPRRLREEFGIGMSDWRTAIDRRVGDF